MGIKAWVQLAEAVISYVRRDGQRVEFPLLHCNEAQLQPTARKVREYSTTSQARPTPLQAHHHCLEAAGAQLGPDVCQLFALEYE